MSLVRTAWRWIAAGIALSLSVAGAASAQESPGKGPAPVAVAPDEAIAQASAVPVLGPSPALGALAGKPIRKLEPQWLRGLPPLDAVALGYDKPLCASLDGFTLHAAARSPLRDRRRRGRPCGGAD